MWWIERRIWVERTLDEQHKIKELIRHATYKGMLLAESIEVLNRALWILRNGDVPCCADCGCPMVKYGVCYKCDNCGNRSGSS